MVVKKRGSGRITGRQRDSTFSLVVVKTSHPIDRTNSTTILTTPIYRGIVEPTYFILETCIVLAKTFNAQFSDSKKTHHNTQYSLLKIFQRYDVFLRKIRLSHCSRKVKIRLSHCRQSKRWWLAKREYVFSVYLRIIYSEKRNKRNIWKNNLLTVQ